MRERPRRDSMHRHTQRARPSAIIKRRYNLVFMQNRVCTAQLGLAPRDVIPDPALRVNLSNDDYNAKLGLELLGFFPISSAECRRENGFRVCVCVCVTRESHLQISINISINIFSVYFAMFTSRLYLAHVETVFYILRASLPEDANSRPKPNAYVIVVDRNVKTKFIATNRPPKIKKK